MEKIGNGTYGSVYRVRHFKTKIDYAAKIEHFSEEKLGEEH